MDLFERFRCVTGFYFLLKKFPERLGIQEQPFDFVGDPEAEGSTTASGVASIAAIDTQRPDDFVPCVLGRVAFEVAMSIQCPTASAMGARRALD